MASVSDRNPLTSRVFWGFFQGRTVYADGDRIITWETRWAIDLEPDGSAASFTEWWMQRPPAKE